VDGDLSVSASHDTEMTVAIAGRGPVGCDSQPVVEREPAAWRDVLGPQPYELAQLISVESSEPETTAATRVWTILESLKKAGANVTAPVVLDSVAGDGWLLLHSGEFRIASFVARLGDSGKQLALTFCNKAAVIPASHHDGEAEAYACLRISPHSLF